MFPNSLFQIIGLSTIKRIIRTTKYIEVKHFCVLRLVTSFLAQDDSLATMTNYKMNGYSCERAQRVESAAELGFEPRFTGSKDPRATITPLGN